MQDIKFRAWDISQEKMVPWEKLQEYKIKTIADGVKNQIWMQYTGLKDKNEKEIYKGDILRWRDSRNLEVKWGTVGWVLYGDLFKKFGLNADSCSEFNTSGYLPYSEIIGNVYENPELLTIENDV